MSIDLDVCQDKEESLYWYAQAAVKGNADSQLILGDIFYSVSFLPPAVFFQQARPQMAQTVSSDLRAPAPTPLK